jgi:hypothetical protein
LGVLPPILIVVLEMPCGLRYLASADGQMPLPSDQPL